VIERLSAGERRPTSFTAKPSGLADRSAKGRADAVKCVTGMPLQVTVLHPMGGP
jgi:hypothetical protein